MLAKTIAYNQSKKIFILFGPLASGKGTQAKKIAKEFNLPHISTGDLLRDHLKRGTDLGKKAESFMKSGQLVPDDLIIDLIQNRIQEDDCKNGFILDGFPRTKPQAIALEGLLKTQNLKVSNVFMFLINEDLAIKRATGRWECATCHTDINSAYDQEFAKQIEQAEKNGTKVYHNRNGCQGEMIHRSDDSAVEAIKNRYNDFSKNTMPAFEELADHAPSLVLDGSKTIDEIFNELLKSIND
ncbi:MAG: nucleoside monophosphate kinase [Candidatus Margulisiibacteriota bacterium]|jgi:adenylate kinase